MKYPPMPNSYFLVASYAYGKTALTAFDNALLKAGVGDLNLLKVSSILPPGAQKISALKIPEGSLTYLAYASKVTQQEGEQCSSCVGIAIDSEFYAEKNKTSGLIMEHSSSGIDGVEIERQIVKMLEEGFRNRNKHIHHMETISAVETHSKSGYFLATFAAVVLYYL